MAVRWTPAAPGLVARAAAAANAAVDDDARAVAQADLAAGARALAAYTAAGTDLLAARAVEPRGSPRRGALKDRAGQYADRASVLQAWLATAQPGAGAPAWPRGGVGGCYGCGYGGGGYEGGGGGCSGGCEGGGGGRSDGCGGGGGECGGGGCGKGAGGRLSPALCTCGGYGGSSSGCRSTGLTSGVASCPCEECRAERRRPRGVPEGGGMPPWLRRPVRDWVPPAADAGRVKVRCRRVVDENGRERVMFQMQGGYDVPGRYQ